MNKDKKPAEQSEKQPIKRKRGRPSAYSKALAARICERLSTGESLRSVCRDDGMPPESTVRKWVLDDYHGFAAHYARARDIGLDIIADEILDISDDGTNDWMESNDPDNPGYKFNGEAASRSRLRVDSRKWYLSKLAPKRYGDRQDINVSGQIEIASAIVAARKRSGK